MFHIFLVAYNNGFLSYSLKPSSSRLGGGFLFIS